MLSSWFANTTLQKGRKIADELDSDEMMIGTAWLSDRPLPSELEYFSSFLLTIFSFFYICRSRKPGFIEKNANLEAFDKNILCPRNICTTKNLVSILQKLTKSKPSRLLALVQWKAQAGISYFKLFTFSFETNVEMP
jgi:hypothetical protein